MRRTCKIYLYISIIMLVISTTSWAGLRVAVMDFENKAQYGGGQLGRGAADILTTELVKIDRFEMYEREHLHSVLEEQNLRVSGQVEPSTAARIGKLIGVSYIITGAISEYGRSKSGGGGGGVKIGKTGYHSAVDIRLVDANTGRIAFADSASHSKSSLQVRVFGIGGGESFNEKLATEAMREAIKEIAAKIATLKLEPKSAGQGVAAGARALVADVDGNIVSFNKGENGGFKKGQTLTLSRKGKTIKDPATGKVLKIKYKEIGKVKLTEVEESYSEGKIISGSGFKVGDIVR